MAPVATICGLYRRNRIKSLAVRGADGHTSATGGRESELAVIVNASPEQRKQAREPGLPLRASQKRK
jgi:hypothetical protein